MFFTDNPGLEAVIALAVVGVLVWAVRKYRNRDDDGSGGSGGGTGPGGGVDPNNQQK